jgi:hypothetical protein
MCLFLYNSGLKWLLLIVTEEFLLLKDLSLSPKDGNSLQIAHHFDAVMHLNHHCHFHYFTLYCTICAAARGTN